MSTDVSITHSFFLRFCRGQKLLVSEIVSPSDRDGLYPIQALVQPIALRFKYHFEGTRQTNRLDKVSAGSILLEFGG